MVKRDYVINDREPRRLFNFFEDIATIPHGSGNEGRLADYIEEFAVLRGLFVYRDKNNNLLIRRPAAVGYEEHAPILIQGHIDMVCESDPGVKIDFMQDGLKLYEKDGFLCADGTTLGADDGVAVAIMLALLDFDALKSPELECLFTTEEETGLTGAQAFDYTMIKSRRMLNLDAGGEVMIVSCAGGMRTDISCRIRESEAVEYTGDMIDIEVSGLCGGHSGVDIHLGRGNANLIMLELIKAARRCDFAEIAELHGGSKDNAIPNRCIARLAVREGAEAVEAAVKAAADEIRKVLSEDDAGFCVKITRSFGRKRIPGRDISERIIALTDDIPCGVISMCDDIDMVETSLNYAVIDFDSNGFKLKLSARSSLDRRLDEIERELSDCAEKYGFHAETDSRYSGWAYEAVSPLRGKYISAYKETTGREIPVKGIHAGLECGIIKRAVPDMDIIATGAETFFEHTTRESLSLESFASVYNTVMLLCSRI